MGSGTLNKLVHAVVSTFTDFAHRPGLVMHSPTRRYPDHHFAESYQWVLDGEIDTVDYDGITRG